MAKAQLEEQAKSVAQSISPSKAGAIIIEKLTGTIIVMMLLLMVVTVFLTPAPSAKQKDMGLSLLEATFLRHNGDIMNEDFMHQVYVFSQGDGNFLGNKYHPDQTLLFLKLNDTVIPRLKYVKDATYATPLEYETDPETGDFVLTDNSDVYDKRRETELEFAGGCSEVLGEAVEDHTTGADCPTSAIFDDIRAAHSDSFASIYLTVAVVVILGLGMGIIGSDIQALLLDPIERLTSIFKTFTKILNPEKDEDKAKKLKMMLDNVRSPVQYMELKYQQFRKETTSISSVIPMDQPLKVVLEAITDMESAFGINLMSTRRSVQQAQDVLKKKISSIVEVDHDFRAGTLTLSHMAFLLDSFVGRVNDYFSQESIDGNATLQIASMTQPLVYKGLWGGVATFNAVIANRVRAAGVVLPHDDMLTNGHITEYFLIEARMLTRMTLDFFGEPIPAGIDKFGFDKLYMASEKVFKKILP